MSNTTRNDVKQLAEKVELLAKEVQLKLDSSGDLLGSLAAANELVRNNLTLVFSLGEVFALEQAGTNKMVRASTVSNPSGTPTNWHNHRDSRGRFARKV